MIASMKALVCSEPRKFEYKTIQQPVLEQNRALNPAAGIIKVMIEV